MSGAAVLRLVEAFFRRWPFYILLLIGSVTFGFMTVSRTTADYTSTGSVFVDSQSLVTVQSGVQDGGFFSYLTPAQFTSQELSGLISTEVFIEAALERAGVTLATEPSARSGQLSEFRKAVDSFASSENLVTVDVTTSEPDLSYRLANAVIAEFVQFQIGVDIAESGASEAFFTDLLEGYRQDLADARSEVDTALRAIAPDAELTPQQQRQLGRLDEAENLADQRFRAAVDNVEASRLAALQAETDIRQTYSVFDPPTLPVKPNGGLKDDLTILAIFGLIGLVLASVGPVASAMLNRAVLFPDDLDLGPGIDVVAVLPKVRKRTLDLRNAVVPAAGDLPSITDTLGNQTITFLPTVAPAAAPETGDPRQLQSKLAPIQHRQARAEPEPIEPPPAVIGTPFWPETDDFEPAKSRGEPERSLPTQPAWPDPATEDFSDGLRVVDGTRNVEKSNGANPYGYADVDDLPDLLEDLLATTELSSDTLTPPDGSRPGGDDDGSPNWPSQDPERQRNVQP